MAALSALVWLLSIGVFLVGVILLFLRRFRYGLLAIGGSFLIWFVSIGMAMSAVPKPTTTTATTTAAPGTSPIAPPKADAIASDAAHDIEVVKSSWKKGGFGSVALWDVTLHNKSKTVTYADLMYRTVYDAPSGTRLDTHRKTLYETLKPGETKHFPEINDGAVNSQAKSAGFFIYGGEAR